MKRKMVSVGFLLLCSGAAVSAVSRIGAVTASTKEEYERMCGKAEKKRAEKPRRINDELANKLMADYDILMREVKTGWNISIGDASVDLHNRCSRFEPEDLQHENLVFTHIPKAGGQSMQVAISEEARFQRVDEKNLHMGHIRLGNVLEWFNGSRDTRSTDYVTMLRDPGATVMSDYNYMRRMKNHNNHKDVAAFRNVDDYLIKKMDDGGPGGFALFIPWGPSNKMIKRLRSFCSRTRRLTQEWRCLCTDLWREVLDRSAEVLAQRYAAVALLERIEDSLEVMRCRVPWLHRLKEIPHHNARPGKTAGKMPTRRAILMRRKTFLQNGLYEFASRLLDADLKCCRRRDKKEPRRLKTRQHDTAKRSTTQRDATYKNSNADGSYTQDLRINMAVKELQDQQQKLKTAVQQLLQQQQHAQQQHNNSIARSRSNSSRSKTNTNAISNKGNTTTNTAKRSLD